MLPSDSFGATPPRPPKDPYAGAPPGTPENSTIKTQADTPETDHRFENRAPVPVEAAGAGTSTRVPLLAANQGPARASKQEPEPAANQASNQSAAAAGNQTSAPAALRAPDAAANVVPGVTGNQVPAVDCAPALTANNTPAPASHQEFGLPDKGLVDCQDESEPAVLGGEAGNETADPLPQNAEVYAGWVALVARIRASETDGMAELYQLFSKGIRFYLCRQLGIQELDDKVHDTFVVVVQAIRKGELREPERLMGFVRTIVRRQVAAHIDKAVQTRREQMDLDASSRVADPHGNPEEAAIFQQKGDLIRRVLGELSSRDREILTRFYLDEETQEEICSEMTLTETQFRLLKSRAKSRFGELGKKRLAQKAWNAISLRTSAGASH